MLKVYKFKITNVRCFEVTAVCELDAKKKLWSTIHSNEGSTLQEITFKDAPDGAKKGHLQSVSGY